MAEPASAAHVAEEAAVSEPVVEEVVDDIELPVAQEVFVLDKRESELTKVLRTEKAANAEWVLHSIAGSSMSVGDEVGVCRNAWTDLDGSMVHCEFSPASARMVLLFRSSGCRPAQLLHSFAHDSGLHSRWI